ncbi:hypothetical protein NDU88_011599 [Pleurodeles waltl]|uniref:Uncharacterized protein n=1 Tax=Pleurodeles waltl TaxID=8319 RepID=A0AAV7S484_PLEWA|nr:hypothetical protein NDU88_011599 [Pleurodeles waltl]
MTGSDSGPHPVERVGAAGDGQCSGRGGWSQLGLGRPRLNGQSGPGTPREGSRWTFGGEPTDPCPFSSCPYGCWGRGQSVAAWGGARNLETGALEEQSGLWCGDWAPEENEHCERRCLKRGATSSR